MSQDPFEAKLAREEARRREKLLEAGRGKPECRPNPDCPDCRGMEDGINSNTGTYCDCMYCPED
jgi:hypothetical protein